MSPAEVELAYRAALCAQPEFRFGRDQLVHLLRSLAPPPPGAPVAWRHAHLQRIIQEVRELNPGDAMEAMLVMQIIAARHAAADSARRSLDPTLSAQLAARMSRNVQQLLRMAGQTERLLKKGQTGRVASGQAPAQVEFDLAALDAAWCGIAGQTLVPGGGGPSPAAPAPVEQVKYTMSGQRIDLVGLATIPAAGSA